MRKSQKRHWNKLFWLPRYPPCLRNIATEFRYIAQPVPHKAKEEAWRRWSSAGSAHLAALGGVARADSRASSAIPNAMLTGASGRSY